MNWIYGELAVLIICLWRLGSHARRIADVLAPEE